MFSIARSLVAFFLLSAVATTPMLHASDWPQWRGADRNGQSSDTGLLQEWPEAGPPLAWKAAGVGRGFSSVAVAGDHIYTLGDQGDDQFVFALKRKGGAIAWKTRIGSANKTDFPGSRSTPTVDGKRVYALGTEGDLLCLDAASGKVHWAKNLRNDLGATLMKAQGNYHWQFSESPLVDGDRVIITPGANDAALVALNAKTGDVIWRSSVPTLGEAGTDGAGYSSVVVSHGAGVKQYVQLLGRGVVGVEAKTGKFLWGYNRVANAIANIPTPLISGDYVFASTGYGAGAVLLHLKAQDGGGVTAEEVYFLEGNEFQNHHGGMLLVDDHVYSGIGHNKGLPASLELATGKMAWGPVRTDGKASAAIAYADGRIYLRYQNGLMILAEATPEEFRQKGSFMIPDVEAESWPHPVIADGMLYLREQDNLYCYDLRAAEKMKKGEMKKKAKKKGKKAKAAR